MESLGIMFHHFHDNFHIKSQGSIDSNSFNMIIDYLEEKFNILNADTYINKVLNKTLSPKDTCITFDDSLRCQYDIALPVLKKRKIKAFFFIYSSALTDDPDKLEIYRFFRNNHFNDIEDFYEIFFKLAYSEYASDYKKAKKSYKNLNYLIDYPYYSNSDKWYRYLRDIVFNDERYHKLMNTLIKNLKFNIKSVFNKIWMTEKQVKFLFEEGHEIGLHSYNHPTRISKLSYEEQKTEYSNNLYHLESLIGKGNVRSMSHPCGSYNDITLQILKTLKIDIGFRANLAESYAKSNLEIPREDHANIMKLLNI